MNDFSGYNVTVINQHYKNLGSRDAKRFSFGEWNEIGFWLDDNGYNQDGFELRITFTNEAKDE